jgi:uncharacterized protein
VAESEGIIVADTGPLIVLAAAGAIDLVRALHGRVIVPPAVAEELRAGGDRPGARLLDEHPWIEQRSLTGPTDRLLEFELERGEAEAIALAVELGKLPLLVDERPARNIASLVYGLKIRGTLGLLVEARQRGLIPELAPLFDRMIAAAGSCRPGSSRTRSSSSARRRTDPTAEHLGFGVAISPGVMRPRGGAGSQPGPFQLVREAPARSRCSTSTLR